MDIPNGTELTNILQEELVSASEKRDEFAAVIENKDYTGNINNVVTERVDFLNHKIDSLKEKINNLENEAQRLKNMNLKEITEMKEKVANHHEELEQQIVVYEDILNSDDSDKSPKRKAILNTALIRKEDELKVVADILDSYQKDERNIVMKINKIFEDKINEINDEIVKIEKEVKELNKLNINTNKAKDVLAIETDKRKLKELDDKVKDIQHRQKYDQTPSEIFDEIEIYFGTLDPVDTKEVNNDDLLEIEDIEPVDFEIESINDKEKVDTELQEDNKLKEDNLELEKEDNDSLDDFTIEKFDLSNQYDLEDEPKEITEERKKVIKVESLDKNSNSDNNNDFIIGDYKDDDYLDMSSLFNDDNNGVL